MSDGWGSVESCVSDGWGSVEVGMWVMVVVVWIVVWQNICHYFGIWKGHCCATKSGFQEVWQPWTEFNEFALFISQGDRYQDARKVAAEPTQFIKALQKAGYATDPQYANKVINVMKSVKEGLKSVLPVETK